MSFDLTGAKLFRLTPEVLFKHFDCGDPDLNDFFLNESKHFSKQLLAVTYILESDTDVIAFFSISNDRISLQDIKTQIIGTNFSLYFQTASVLKVTLP